MRSIETASARSRTSRPAACGCRAGRLKEITSQYPELGALGAAVDARAAVLDGEIVGFDAEGRPSFERLQQRMHQTQKQVISRRLRDVPVVYVILDLLHLDDRSLLAAPYTQRRAQLEALGLEGGA